MDSFFGIGLFELVMIAVIALLVLGPERLPGAMREVAKYMKQLRNISNEFQSQFSEELKLLDEINPRRILNEAIDPNSPTTTAAKPPAQAATTPAAKPVAKPAAAATKPLAPKPVTPAPVVTNGEPTNSILPPPQTESPPAEPAVAAEPEVSADAEPAPEDPPPTDRKDRNGSDPTAPADPGVESSQ